MTAILDITPTTPAAPAPTAAPAVCHPTATNAPTCALLRLAPVAVDRCAKTGSTEGCPADQSGCPAC